MPEEKPIQEPQPASPGESGKRTTSRAEKVMKTATLVAFLTGVFTFACTLFRSQVLSSGAPRFFSDLPSHIRNARLIFEGDLRSTQAGYKFMIYWPAKLLGISLKNSGIIVTALLVVLIAAVIYLILKKSLDNEYSHMTLLFATAVLLVVSTIYVPFFSKYLYGGQGTPNTWHNPTTIAVKPFAFFAFWLFPLVLARPFRGRDIWYYVLLALVVLASAYTKASFVAVFVPAVCLMVLLRGSKEMLWKSSLVLLPCLALLAVQFFATFGQGADAEPVMVMWQGKERAVFAPDQMIISFLGVWRTKSSCIPVSILLALAFPLSVLICRFRRVIKDRHLSLAWVMVIVGILEYAVLAEKRRFAHGNFAWGYYIAMQILFIFTMIEYLRWYRTQDRAGTQEQAGFWVTSGVLGLHLVSGFYYTAKILTGGSYM